MRINRTVAAAAATLAVLPAAALAEPAREAEAEDVRIHLGEKPRRAAPPPVSPQLQAIAACESGGDPTAVDASGTYRGKYQFDQQTWESVGGSGDPAAAPEAEQDARAQALLEQRGASPWPVCG